jgi:hypothetical protein
MFNLVRRATTATRVPLRQFRTAVPAAFRIGDVLPNFTAETTEGEIDFHQWIGNDWALLVSVRDFLFFSGLNFLTCFWVFSIPLISLQFALLNWPSLEN